MRKRHYFGENVKIGQFCIIEDDVTLGNNVTLKGSVRIASGTVVEDDCFLHYGVILTKNVLVKRNVFIGPNSIALGTTHERKSVYGTVIGENCFIGAGSQIAPGIQICDNVTLGAFSFANKNIKEPGIYVGIPVRKVK